MNIKDLQHKDAPKPDRLQKPDSPELPVDKMVSSRVGEIFIELDGKLTNIKDLQPKEYEYFLKCMQATIIAYNVLNTKRPGRGY